MNPVRRAPLVMPAFGLAALSWLASAASAQTVLIDQGSFRLSLGGREIGRDSFNIRRTGSGDDARILAQGWLELDGRRVSSVVETTGRYGFTRYQATVSGAETAEIMVGVSGRRLELTVKSPAGEQTREARARDGAVLLDENIVHQYYFVGVLAREGASIPVIVPRHNDQGAVDVQSVTPESLTIDGQQVDAMRLLLSAAGVERRLWVDPQGRVLRLEVPSTGFVAERLRAPS